MGSIKNLIFIGLGINKMALEALNEFLSRKIQDKSTNKDMAEEFLGASIKKPNLARNKNSRTAQSRKVPIK